MTRTHDLCPKQVENRTIARIADLGDAIRRQTIALPYDTLNGRGREARALLDDLMAEWSALTDALNAHAERGVAA